MISKLLIIIDQFPFVYFWENVGTTFSSINDFLEESNLLNFYHIYFIVHDIYSSFDCHSSLEVTGTFSHISKSFYSAMKDYFIKNSLPELRDYA